MNILIIEKSKSISHILKNTLIAYGYNITQDYGDFNSESLVGRDLFSIIILNTNVQGRFSTQYILEYIKGKKGLSCKVLGLCTVGNWKDKVNFLNSGGDDVLSYPFPIQELIARIQSLLRRPKSYVDSRLYIGNMMIDTQDKSVSVGEKSIPMRKKEYQLLEDLVRNKNRTISRCELLDHVWDYRSYTGSNTIDVHIKRIREKINSKSLIETIHGQGYKLREKKPL